MLAIAPVQQSTPTRGLPIIYDIIPLINLVKFLGCKAYHRQANHMALEGTGVGKGVRHSVSHRRYWMDVIDSWNVDLTQTDS